jgi:hypothetical protein
MPTVFFIPAHKRATFDTAVYVSRNACLINVQLFIHFLVRLAFRPSGQAPKGPQLTTTLTNSSTTLAPTPRRQRLTTVGGRYDTIIQPFLSCFLSRRFSFQAFLLHKNGWMAKFGILGPKLVVNTPQSGHRSAP